VYCVSIAVLAMLFHLETLLKSLLILVRMMSGCLARSALEFDHVVLGHILLLHYY